MVATKSILKLLVGGLTMWRDMKIMSVWRYIFQKGMTSNKSVPFYPPPLSYLRLKTTVSPFSELISFANISVS